MNTAISTNFLLWALLMFSCPDPAWTTQTEEMASLEARMTNIMDRMTRLEAEMIAKDQRIAVLEAAMENKDQRIAVLEDALETRDFQVCELEEEMKSLTGRITVTEETDVLLRGMVDQVSNPPFACQCAWQHYWTADNSVITYDRLTYDEISGGDRGLDINTGVFTVGQGYSGIWEISYTIQSGNLSGDESYVWLYINGKQIEESGYYTYFDVGFNPSGSQGYVT